MSMWIFRAELNYEIEGMVDASFFCNYAEDSTDIRFGLTAGF